MKINKSLLAVCIAAIMSSSAFADNYGFEDGNTTGWTLGGTTSATSLTNNQITGNGVGAVLINGTVTFNANNFSAVGSPSSPYYAPAVTAKQWQFSPYGTYMLGLQPGGYSNNFDTMTSALGLTSTENTAIKSMLTSQATASTYGSGTPTNAAWAYTTVDMVAGTKFKMAWNYIGTDYVPFNDGSITSLSSISGSSTGIKVNNYSAGYALLGFTNPMTGDYSTGTFGSTGWQISTYEVTTSGQYKLGFASFNLDDTALSPILLVDSQQGTTQTCDTSGANCTTFGSVAPNNSTAPVASDEGGTGGGSSGGGTTPPVTPTLVNNITGTVTSADLDTAPKFNGGTLMMTDGEDITKNFTITNNGGTINANNGTSTISGVISNDNNDTDGTLTIGGTGTIAFSGANTYTGPTVINNGAGLVLLNSNALGGTTSVTNNGGLNITGAGNVGINGSYTQGSNAGLIATLVPTGATQLNATGPVNLAGTYTLWANQGPYAYGKYTLITGSSVTGQFDTFATNLDSSYGNYLKYSNTDVKFYVTPNASATQSSIDNTTKNLANAINLQSNAVINSLGNDCAVFGEKGGCASLNVGSAKTGSGDLFTGGLTVAKKVNDNWRVGVVTNAPTNNPTIGNVSQTSNPAYGLFATWTKDQLSIQGSAAFNQGAMNIIRQGPEVGTGKMSVDNKAYQVKASYTVPVNDTITITPYAGVRYVESNYGGYTEQGPVFPLTVNSTKNNTTSVIAGVTVTKQLTDKVSGNVSLGAVQTVSGQTSIPFTGTSEIAGLSSFSSNLPSNGNINPSVGAGLNYSIDDTTKVGVNVGWQAKGNNANINSFGVSLTKGF